MKLKRIFQDGEKSVDECRDDGEFVASAYLQAGGTIRVRVQNLSEEWHVSPRIVERGQAEGFIQIADGKLTLKAPEGESDTVFQIVAPPNREQGKHYYDCRVVN